MLLVLPEVQAPVTERARGKKSLVDGLKSVPLCYFHPMLAMAKELKGTFSRAQMHRLQQAHLEWITSFAVCPHRKCLERGGKTWSMTG